MILVFFEWLLIWTFLEKRQKSLFIYLTYKVSLKAKGLFRIVISNHSHRQFYHCKNFKMFYIHGFLIHSSIDRPSTCNKIEASILTYFGILICWEYHKQVLISRLLFSLLDFWIFSWGLHMFFLASYISHVSLLNFPLLLKEY